MRARTVFILAFITLMAIAVGLLFAAKGVALWCLEGGVVLLGAALWLLYFSLLRPINALHVGMSLLYEQDFASRLVKVGQPEADNIAAVFNHLMSKLKDERLRVREQNHLLDLIIKASPMGIVIFSTEGRVADFNQAAADMLDVENPRGMRLDEIPGELAAAAANMKYGESAVVRLSDNSIVKCSMLRFIDRGFHRRFILLESLTEEVMKAERATYVKVIRTLSHEVNNTLAGVIPLFDTVAAVSDDELMREVASSCSERCASLGKFIKDYAEVVKVPQPNIAACNLNNLVQSLSAFLESIATGRDIRFCLDLDTQPVVVQADSVMMEQVLVNVVKNSVESIEHGGEIRLRTCAQPATLEVIDNGKGIPPDVAESLFAPFFSTKEGSQGIGLTLVAEILHRHRCRFRIATSAADGLTRFTVVFA